MTGAEFIVKFFLKNGVETLFGYPGAAILPLYDALYDNKINHVLVRHELGASFAASGYAKASGKVGVCISTSGPGAINLANGIADAYLDSVPMIIITGQVDSASIGRDAFQEADVMGMTLPITKHNYLIRYPSQLPAALCEAWSIATSDRYGPVLLDITKNVLSEDVGNNINFDNTETLLPRKRLNEYNLISKLDSIKKAIEESFRPCILAGGGVVSANAAEQLAQFAKKSAIPLVSTLMGRGIVINYEDVRDYGMAGIHGTPAAKAALSQCDLLIAAGCRFSDRTIPDFKTFERSRTIIHCDIDPAEINKNLTAHIAVVCGADEFFEALCGLDTIYDTAAIESWNEHLLKYRRRHEIKLHEDRLSNWEIVRILNEVQNKYRNALYITDVGDFQLSAARELDNHFQRGFITSGGLGSMGFGLPAAIGASLTNRTGVSQIVMLCGDGGFQMTMHELSTMAKYAVLPVKIFIFDNSSLRMIKNMQTINYGGRLTDSSLSCNPDFEMIGKAYNIKTCRLTVGDRKNLYEKIENILCENTHMIIRCLV